MNDGSFSSGITGGYPSGFISVSQASQGIVFHSGTGIAGSYVQETSFNDGKLKRISPKLYFSYVKSKLNKTQTKRLKARLQKLQSLVKSAEENGQHALHEEMSKMLIVAVRESEAAACGYDVFVEQSTIFKFQGLVTEHEKTYNNPVKFCSLESFPRPVPAKVAKIIKSVQSKKLFDELHVLYLDYTNEKIKSNKEKIREKDPILFGKFSYDNNRFFFITDWIDEHCDLTLSTFVDKLKQDDKEYETKQIEEITPEYLERIKKEIKERDERLSKTNPGNFRQLMSEEDKAKERAKWRDEAREELKKELEEEINKRLEAPVKKPWYKRIFGF